MFRLLLWCDLDLQTTQKMLGKAPVERPYPGSAVTRLVAEAENIATSPLLKAEETFLVMPMPESSMVKVELVLSGNDLRCILKQTAATERGVTGIDPA